ARFGAGADDVTRAASWLEDQGLRVEGHSRTMTQLFFSVSVAAVEQALHTELHWYRSGGERHFAMSRPLSIPGALSHLILGLHGLHSFRPVAVPRSVHAHFEESSATSMPALGPADFATIYDVGPLYAAGIDGTGMRVAIAGQTSLPPSDYATFRSTFGLS